jgi:2-keto-4-pentenoate hydratase/2-oxohepta-3-ene-1,7-dioic acid hydratase in catechol pathway
VRIGVARIREVSRLVAWAGDHVVDIAAAAEAALLREGATQQRAAQLAATAYPASLTQVLASGGGVLRRVSALLADPPPCSRIDGHEARMQCPVDPPSYRDFMTFDEHVRNTYEPTGKPPPAVLYELPAYYKGSTATLIGPEDEVCWPRYAESVDYEAEFALVIGKPGIDLIPAQALDYVFGVTLLNDFSARDQQFWEARSRLGPAKGKDFATALGPWVVTLDEIDTGNLAIAAWLNGTQVASANSSAALWTVSEIVAWASAAEPLRPGDVLGSGTIGGGSGLEAGKRLGEGDVVELTLAGVGTLRNYIGQRQTGGWMPEARSARTGAADGPRHLTGAR